MGKKKTDTDVHKEKKKDTMKKNDVVLQKKNSFTAADNILLDADEAVKLAESISLTVNIKSLILFRRTRALEQGMLDLDMENIEYK
ncbi:hypothetical protein Tco_0029833 [Tanacetum coccineum]